ncbi:putative bifunctional diguanylate cyclase/phosphodiesterase [Ruegeria aquimaris]|uniref:Bifunctional diguanylate cyclase/phosphodiesterase n=1 Tax=Ruegeria aquimaris TaxID=2984333 RepID=A0ABT3AR38_9RHOB|nr:bifunctional diguanylate cyclase/phosphodiesterase [Ruegeria sp. XHP0148]MCV2891131.1 bifunctional diguanylate cyclase/phosphodiesterase [Ruegeria sp. XHP0148]
MQTKSLLTRIRDEIIPILTGPPILAFLPAITLGAFWLGGEIALLLTSLGLPLLFALAGALGKWPMADRRTGAVGSGMVQPSEFEAATHEIFASASGSGRKSACFVVELDDFPEFLHQHGHADTDLVLRRVGERLLSAVRDNDIVSQLGRNRFAICLAPVPQLDLELCIQLAGRMQAKVEDPISLGAAAVYVSCSIGFCQSNRVPGQNASSWLSAAEAALFTAQQASPSGIRAYSPDMAQPADDHARLRNEIEMALDKGQIQPWYQPQISTDTGKITGFEALARWIHPVRGVLTPNVFLPVIEQAGYMERLGQVMLFNALTALKAWDSAGVDVPRVGVNFASDELRNPGLVERIRWELDRFDLTPDRLAVEILETVFSNTPDDVITRNISGLGKMGCRIDLDDFGTGHASIASIRRFDITRIKIDRSFVKKADRDPEQQRMVAAILTMAERLELETLAEGVETVGEHAVLAQLGCDHVQGFGIGKPMPFDQTLDWIAQHEAKLQDAPQIGRETG